VPPVPPAGLQMFVLGVLFIVIELVCDRALGARRRHGPSASSPRRRGGSSGASPAAS
jgi:hypothetical protein